MHIFRAPLTDVDGRSIGLDPTMGLSLLRPGRGAGAISPDIGVLTTESQVVAFVLVILHRLMENIVSR